MNDSTRPAQAALLRAAALALTVWLLAGCGSDPVDPALVGTWEIPGPGGASWQLAIDANGRYAFTNAGVGTAPSHSGEFTANAGEWSLRDAAGSIEDRGTYEVVAGVLQLTGNRGFLQWGRAAASAPSAELAVQPTLGAAPGFAASGAVGNAAPVPAPTPPGPGAAAPSPVSASAATAGAPGTLPEIIDPCLLVTEQEAGNLLGVAVATKRTTPQPRTQNDCFYSGSGATLSVRSDNGRGLDAARYLENLRTSGGEALPGVGDGAYLIYREATGLTSVDFVIGRSTFGLLASGIARERADPGLRQLAAQAAARLRTPAAAFRVPGTAGFAGTWKVSTTVAGKRSPDMMFSVAQDGTVRVLTSGGASGDLVLEGARWRIDDPFNSIQLAGEYRLRGDRLTFGGDTVSAELDRVACKQRPQRVRPPYDFTRDIAGMLSGDRPGRAPTPAPASFDPKLAGLWEGEGKLNGSPAEFLVSIDAQATIVLAAFPRITGRFDARDGRYTLELERFGESSGTYQFAGGINDGTIRMEEPDGQTYTWTPYDPDRRPPYDPPIVANCG
jgi:hypothetical protein